MFTITLEQPDAPERMLDRVEDEQMAETIGQTAALTLMRVFPRGSGARQYVVRMTADGETETRQTYTVEVE
jgi:hypothetical protein